MVMLINSTYGRAFKAIRDDEVAAEAMGINLAHHKMISFCISSFFAGVGGAMFAMFVNQAQAKPFTTSMTYEILLIVVIGGIGSISGSCLAAFLYVAASEWWLRFLDSRLTFLGIQFRPVPAQPASAWWYSRWSSWSWCCSSAVASWGPKGAAGFPGGPGPAGLAGHHQRLPHRSPAAHRLP